MWFVCRVKVKRCACSPLNCWVAWVLGCIGVSSLHLVTSSLDKKTYRWLWRLPPFYLIRFSLFLKPSTLGKEKIMNVESLLSSFKVLRTYCESLTLNNVKSCFVFVTICLSHCNYHRCLSKLEKESWKYFPPWKLEVMEIQKSEKWFLNGSKAPLATVLVSKRYFTVNGYKNYRYY